MGPALSSVTSLVAKLPSVTKVLSFIYKHSLVKLLGNPVSKFTTSHICAVPQKLVIILLSYSGSLRAHQEPHLRPHGNHRELGRQGGRGRRGVRHPDHDRGQQDQAADLKRKEQREEQRSGVRLGAANTNCRGEIRIESRGQPQLTVTMGK